MEGEADGRAQARSYSLPEDFDCEVKVKQ